MTTRQVLFRCNGCAFVMAEDLIKVIHVDHPKGGRDRIAVSQCPECGEVNDFTNVCDEPDCDREASCGFPTASGHYRRTCGQHMDAATDRAK